VGFFALDGHFLQSVHILINKFFEYGPDSETTLPRRADRRGHARRHRAARKFDWKNEVQLRLMACDRAVREVDRAHHGPCNEAIGSSSELGD